MKPKRNFWGKTFLVVVLFITFFFHSRFVQAQESPEPAPPKVDLGVQIEIKEMKALIKQAPTMEWTLHKTADGSHPDGIEQAFMDLMNHARANPTQEGIFLATTDDPDVDGARNFFDVDLQLLKDEFAEIDPKPPAAFDGRLYEAAREHSEYLISIDDQNHDGQLDRVDASGFVYTSGRVSVFSYAKSPLHGHAAWNIDWGESNDGTGMQEGRGHRAAIMSADGNYTNVGIAAVYENDPNTDVGPLVVTGNYFEANASHDNHFNRFIVGSVFEDQDGDSRYDPGEGIGGVTVTPNHGTYYAVSGTAGGYAIPILSSGDYEVTITGSGVPASLGKTVNAVLSRTITVGSESVLLDFEIGSLQECGDENGLAITNGTITFDATPLCAMVLANGQYMFTCGNDLGVFDLEVPVDQECEITLYGFVAGFSPFKTVLSPGQAQGFNILMTRAAANSKEMEITVETEQSTTNSNLVRVSGTVSFEGTPLCAMILINGQSMFSCGADLGRFDLEVPLDGNGQITLYGFVSGFAPFKWVFTP
jgi:hypothetical protein